MMTPSDGFDSGLGVFTPRWCALYGNRAVLQLEVVMAVTSHTEGFHPGLHTGPFDLFPLPYGLQCWNLQMVP